MTNSNYRVLLEEIIWKYEHERSKKLDDIYFDILTREEQINLALQYTLCADADEKYEILTEALTCQPVDSEVNSKQKSDVQNGLWLILLNGETSYHDKISDLLVQYLHLTLVTDFDDALMSYRTLDVFSDECDIWRDNYIDNSLCFGTNTTLGKSHES